MRHVPFWNAPQRGVRRGRRGNRALRSRPGPGVRSRDLGSAVQQLQRPLSSRRPRPGGPASARLLCGPRGCRCLSGTCSGLCPGCCLFTVSHSPGSHHARGDVGGARSRQPVPRTPSFVGTAPETGAIGGGGLQTRPFDVQLLSNLPHHEAFSPWKLKRCGRLNIRAWGPGTPSLPLPPAQKSHWRAKKTSLKFSLMTQK